jgi:hypothetical protein
MKCHFSNDEYYVLASYRESANALCEMRRMFLNN